MTNPLRSRYYLTGLILLATGFGGIVLHRNLFLHRNQGDLHVYCHAGWAVRQGGHLLYHVSDDHGWHYHYLPPFAVLMAPFAEPPRRDLALSAAAAAAQSSPLAALTTLAAGPAATGPPPSYLLPYPATVALVYLLNVGFVLLAIHLLARTLLDGLSPERWWPDRATPFLVCLPAIGLTLVRGQVQLLLLLLLTGFLVGLVRNRRLTAGMCLAGAICLKVFPAYLLLVPLLRRDGRCLAGCAAGLLLGLVALPVTALGWRPTVQLYLDRSAFLTSVFATPGTMRPGAAEMLEATGSQSQSFQVVLHKTLHLLSDEVPPLPAPWVRVTHWLLAGLLTLAVLLPGDVRREYGEALARRVALLTLLMILTCPICHLHYFTLAIPLIVVLLSAPTLPGRTLTFAAFILALSLPMVPGLRFLRDLGVPMYAALALGGLAWAEGVRLLRPRGHSIAPSVTTTSTVSPSRITSSVT